MDEEPWFLFCLPGGVTKLAVGNGEVDAFSAMCQALGELPCRPIEVETTPVVFAQIFKHQAPHVEYLSAACLRVWAPGGGLIVKCA